MLLTSKVRPFMGMLSPEEHTYFKDVIAQIAIFSYKSVLLYIAFHSSPRML